MYYESIGEGEPLVLIMGFAANLDWWPPEFIEPIARKFRVITFDNRGSGRTEGPVSRYTIPRAADDTAALMDAMKIPRAHVFGLSMGGMIAQELVLRHPQWVNRLILGATAPAPANPLRMLSHRPLKVFWRYFTDPKLRAMSIEASFIFDQDYLLRTPGIYFRFMKEARRIPPTFKTRFFHSLGIIRFNATRRLKTIKARTLIIAGTRDSMVPYRNSPFMTKKIIGSRLVTLDETGHAFVKERLDSAQTIRDFLEES